VLEFFITGVDSSNTGTLQGLGGVTSQLGQFLARLQAEADLLHAKELAERANEAKSLFLATMSHEVRTPLNGILGFADMLLDGRLSVRQRSDVETIRRSGEILLHLINDVLDFARIESGSLTIKQVAFSPLQLVAETMEVHGRDAASKGLELRWRIAQEIPAVLLGDPARVRQVLVNLVTNALKFTPSGSVETVVSVEGERLCFLVSDTGIGFDPALTEQLFEPFQQVDASATQKYGGAGLGLSICKRLVELMGGQITAESQPRVGSSFSFWVPMVSAEQPAEHSSFEGNPPQVPDAGGRRVLVAEDNPVNAHLIRMILERLGCRVQSAGNGKEALEEFAKGEFAAVLMDLRMPVMDGLDAIQRLRAGEAGPQGRVVPVLALTASVLPSDRAACARAGADYYVSKPIRRNELIAALEAAGMFSCLKCPEKSAFWRGIFRKKRTSEGIRGCSH
jgi:signal transduction histidine kinase/ActR/RegA family two-component response regulator